MNCRYYIRGDKLCPRYKRKVTHSRRAIRSREVKSIIKRRRIINTIMLVCLILFASIGIYFVSFHNELNETDIEAFNLEVIPIEYAEVPIVIDEEEPVEVAVIEEKDEIADGEIIKTKIDTAVFYGNDLVFRNRSGSKEPMIINGYPVVKFDLPSKYYNNLDFSSFQAMESISAITNTSSSAYKTCNGDDIYVDECGLIRRHINENELSVGYDDYVVAMGSFYNESGDAGHRFLIETNNGSFTVTVGDAKADKDTDPMNMFTLHNGKACIIEFIYDSNNIHHEILSAGTPMNGPDPVISGEIIGVYKIS